MEENYNMLLELVRIFVTGSEDELEIFNNKYAGKEIEWNKIYKIAVSQRILPMIYDVLRRAKCEVKINKDEEFLWRQAVMCQISANEQKRQNFYKIYNTLIENDIKVVVLKGTVFKDLYLNDSCRISSDEDLWINKKDLLKTHKILTDMGLVCAEKNIEDVDVDFEKDVSYMSKNNTAHVEIHVNLFERHEKLYEDMNNELAGAFDRTIEKNIDGHIVNVLEYTDQFIYSFFHMYKHFISRGAGIRQITDIMLYGKKYCGYIDVLRVKKTFKRFNMYEFFKYLNIMSKKYLGISCDAVSEDDIVNEENVCKICNELLLDMMAAGIYGQASDGRRHGSTITTQAVLNSGKNHKKRNWVMQILFPSYKYLVNREPILRKHPYLLPVIWIKRIYVYATGSTNHAKHIKMSKSSAEQRIALLKKVGIIE